MSDKQQYYYGVGRRKSSTARAKYYPSGENLEIEVNGKKLKDYFPEYFSIIITESCKNLGIKTGIIKLFIRSGGNSGQSQAARLAIAKAVVVFSEEFRPVARSFGYLTTDIRKVLPKRPGLRKARKREQWSKR